MMSVELKYLTIHLLWLKDSHESPVYKYYSSSKKHILVSKRKKGQDENIIYLLPLTTVTEKKGISLINKKSSIYNSSQQCLPIFIFVQRPLSSPVKWDTVG